MCSPNVKARTNIILPAIYSAERQSKAVFFGCRFKNEPVIFALACIFVFSIKSRCYINILEIYNRTELIKKDIDSNISRLIKKPLQFVVYESSWCNEELLLPLMLRIHDIINRNITLEQIIFDIYEYEISKINNKIKIN